MRPGQSLRQRLALMMITNGADAAGIVRTAEAALRGGAPAIQLRWKTASTRDLLGVAHRLRSATREFDALLIVNDRVDVAISAEADGAHLGADDLPLGVARRIVPEGFLLGLSVDTAAEAAAAEKESADYVGLGPIFPTRSKAETGPVVGLNGIAEVRATTGIPIVAIGGIDTSRVREVLRAGADGVAVVAAISGAADPARATAELLDRIRAATGEH